MDNQEAQEPVVPPSAPVRDPMVLEQARELAMLLGEPTFGEPFRQIHRIIRILGYDYAKEMQVKALSLQEQGGLYFHTPDGERWKRTLGGIFFSTIRKSLTIGKRKKVFLAPPKAFSPVKPTGTPEGEKPTSVPPPLAEAKEATSVPDARGPKESPKATQGLPLSEKVASRKDATDAKKAAPNAKAAKTKDPPKKEKKGPSEGKKAKATEAPKPLTVAELEQWKGFVIARRRPAAGGAGPSR